MLYPHDNIGTQTVIGSKVNDTVISDYIDTVAVGTEDKSSVICLGYSKDIALAYTGIHVVFPGNDIAGQDCDTAGICYGKCAVLPFADHPDSVGIKAVGCTECSNFSVIVPYKRIIAEGTDPQPVLAVAHYGTYPYAVKHLKKVIYKDLFALSIMCGLYGDPV